MENILTKAVLVKLSISQFNPKRQDAKTTREVLNDKNAERSAGVWMKNLIDPKTLEKITSLGMQARQAHYKLSLPYADEGWRILPITMYERYQTEARAAHLAFNSAVEEFLIRFPQYIEDAKQALNGMYNAADYPSTEVLKSKFGFNVDFTPLPSADDFRFTLGAADMDSIKADVETRVKDATENAIKNLWQRLAEPIKHLITKLGDKDSIFRDSLVENIREIVSLVPALNVTDDSALNALTAEINSKLARIEPDLLRQNQSVRQNTIKQADEILKKMEGYL